MAVAQTLRTFSNVRVNRELLQHVGGGVEEFPSAEGRRRDTGGHKTRGEEGREARGGTRSPSPAFGAQPGNRSGFKGSLEPRGSGAFRLTLGYQEDRRRRRHQPGVSEQRERPAARRVASRHSSQRESGCTFYKSTTSAAWGNRAPGYSVCDRS